MSPVLVMVLGWLVLGLELGLRSSLRLDVAGLSGSPSFVVPLAVVIGLCASPAATLWSCLALGLGVDLLTPIPTATGSVVVIGPHALGYLVAGQFVLVVRGLVIRKNPFTVVALSIVAAALMEITVTAALTLRHSLPFFHDPTEWRAAAQLASRLFSAVLTGASGLVMGLLLLPLAPGLGLQQSHSRQWVRR